MLGFSRRKSFEKLAFVGLTLVSIPLLCGCDLQVTPPINPAHPTLVYVCDYGVHSSLLLPVAPRRYVEFLYGDWNWAALGHTGAFDAIGAVFFSRQSTLGRRFIDQRTGDSIPRPIDGPKTEMPLTVDGVGCSLVVTKLMKRWELHQSTALATPSGLIYVKDDVPYSWTHDCNQLTADCLREMGCRVDGCAVWSNFKIVKPMR